MKYNIIFIFIFFFISNCLIAQKNKPVTVKAGTRVIDYFSFQERYRYPEFLPGKVIFKNGIYSETMLNYNLLKGEMEFIKSLDTLSIINKNDIKLVIAEQDTFYYDNGYIELISDGSVKVGLKQLIELKEIRSKDSYGTSSSGSATNSYGSLPMDGNFYKLTANKDMVFQKTSGYYLSVSSNNFVSTRKKNILNLIPEKKVEIKKYLKSNKVDLNSEKDIIKLAAFLRTLLI